MTVALTQEQLTGYKRRGWKVFQPGFDISYKGQWNTPWFFIREFFQNALDEHDQAGVTAKPTLTMTAKGAVIEDRGRGLGAESLLLRESKGEGDLRGRFGEGMKFACISAVRQGYVILIESPSITIEAHSSPQTMGKVEANLLTFIYKEQERPRVGTRATIEGYIGELYKDRFTTFLGKPIFELSKVIGRFNRQEAIYTEPKGRLYVGDIFIRELSETSDYSYNLWGLELNPDRVSEVNYSALSVQAVQLWKSLNSQELAIRIIKAITAEETFEGNLYWYGSNILNTQYWLEAWYKLYGKRAVLRTNANLSRLAEGYGYEAVGEKWSSRTRDLLRNIVPTDESIVAIRMKELTTPRVIKDSELNRQNLTNLKLVRFLSDSCGSCTYHGKKPLIVAARIPLDPRTGDVILGLCSPSEGTIYLSTDILDTEESALSTFYHEIGHWVGWPDSVDGSMEHTRAVQQVASAISLIILAKASQIDEILGLKPAPVAPPVVPPPGIPPVRVFTPIQVEIDRRYSLDDLRRIARDRGVSASGDKKALAAKLIESGFKLESSGGSSSSFPQLTYRPMLTTKFTKEAQHV